MTLRIALLSLVTMPMALGGCPKEQHESRRLYFKLPLAPVGTAAEVVSDVSLDRRSGGSIALAVAVDPAIDREELDRLMDSFFRQVSSRRGFARGVAERVDLRFYGSKVAAEAGGDDWLGQILRLQAYRRPKRVNRRPLPLARLAEQALGRQPQFSDALRPRVEEDLTRSAVTVELPFVNDDGDGKWANRLTYAMATTNMTSTIRSLFDKIAPLREVTFVGLYRDRVVMRVTMTRSQYQRAQLSQLEEWMGAARGKLMPQLASGQLSDKRAEAMLEKRRRELYHKMFADLPPHQVTLQPPLR